MNKIKKVSLFFRVVFQIIFVALPLLAIIAWMNRPEALIVFDGLINLSFIPQVYSSSILHSLSYSERLLGFGISAIPLAIQLFIFYSLIKLFKLYEKGEIFSINNVLYIRRIGYALLFTQVINPFYEALMGVVITWHNPPGHRFASVTLDQTNIGVILISLLVILISWVMAEGCKLREEQQFTI